MKLTRQLIDPSGNHTVQICLTENSKIDLVTRYIKEGLLNEEGIFIISAPKLRKTLKLKMDELSFDEQLLQDSNQIRFFDAEFLLSSLKSDESIGEEVLQTNITDPINKAQLKYDKIHAFSEMVDILWKKNHHDMVMQLTDYGKNLINTQELCLLCTYSLDQLDPNLYEEALERICKYHSYLAPQEDDSLIEEGIGETTKVHAFGAAWNRVMDKLAN